MKLEYTLLLAAIGLLYALIKNFFPDFPIQPDVLIAFFLYVLAKLGVEVVGQPLRSYLTNKGLIGPRS